MTLNQALIDAHRCLLCHDAPCSSACPGGTDPGRFIRQLRFTRSVAPYGVTMTP